MVQETADARDKRRFRRYRVNFPCVVKPKKVQHASIPSELQTETHDVSRGGLFFTATADFRIGTEIECTIQLPIKSGGNKPVTIRCRGEIARLIPLEDGGIGVGATIDSFEFLNPAKRREGEKSSDKRSPFSFGALGG